MRPVTVCVPLVAVLLTPLPETDTEVALVLDHAIVEDPGAVADVGEALIDALTDAAEVTVTTADWVTGPPLPWAVMVKVWLPTARPLTAWLPVAAALLMPGPLTETEVALPLVQVMVLAPGASALVGLAAMEAETLDGAATVTVWLIVADTAPLESTAFAVNVIVAGPLSEVVLPESWSVPLPPPANAKPTPDFQTLT